MDHELEVIMDAIDNAEKIVPNVKFSMHSWGIDILSELKDSQK